MKKHKSDFEHCGHCQYIVNSLDGLDSKQELAEDMRKRHNAALKRSERDAALRGLGLVRVRGALGGVYWE